MTLELPGLGSDPPNWSGRERGASIEIVVILYFHKIPYEKVVFICEIRSGEDVNLRHWMSSNWGM